MALFWRHGHLWFRERAVAAFEAVSEVA